MAGRCTAAGARPESLAAGRGLPAPVFAGGSAGSGSDPPEEEKRKLLGLGGKEELCDWVEGTRDCRVGRLVSRSSVRGDSGGVLPHPISRRVFPPGLRAEAGGLGRGRCRRGAGGRRAGAERGPLGSRRLCWADAGRVGPPGATERAAFLMCHQHVVPGRVERASERNPATLEGPCCSAHVLPCAAGGPRRSPRSGSRSGEAGGSSARRAPSYGNSGARGPGCGHRVGRSGLGPEAPQFGPASPGWAQVTGRRAPGASRARRAGAGKFLGVQPSHSGGYGAGGAHLPRPQHCFSGCVHCASCNPSRAGFGAHRPRPGGADGFFAERSSSLRGAKN